MSAPQDQFYEPRNPDQTRPLERDPTRAELRERLERLPPSHPSSPHNDDGSRKPPEPGPASRELPIPGDPDYCPETSTDRPLPTDDAPHINPDGSWECKGKKPLTRDEVRIADEAQARWLEAEGRNGEGNYGESGLTPSMRRIEIRLDDGHLVAGTEEYALKSPDRFKEKLVDEKAKQPDKTVTELAVEIHDSVRYTFILDEADYVESYWAAEETIDSEGYALEMRRNMWADSEYKGINSRWRDPQSGLPFEIQFHTEASWEAKQTTHWAYERITDVRTPAEDLKRLHDYQKNVSASVPKPPRVMEVPDYRKEVRAE